MNKKIILGAATVVALAGMLSASATLAATSTSTANLKVSHKALKTVRLATKKPIAKKPLVKKTSISTLKHKIVKTHTVVNHPKKQTKTPKVGTSTVQTVN